MTGVDWSSLVRYLIRLCSSVTRCCCYCNSCAGFVIVVDGSSLARHLIFRFASALTDTFGVNIAERRHHSRICYEAAVEWMIRFKDDEGRESGRWADGIFPCPSCLGKEVDRGGSVIYLFMGERQASGVHVLRLVA